MSILEAILLGILQGLTEWLPISSSGHLALAERRMGEVPMVFNVMLHMGTTLVLIVYMRREIRRVLHEVRETFRDMRKGMPFSRAWMMNVPRKMAWLVALATLPTMLFGLIMDRYVLELFLTDPNFLGAAFVLTGILLLTTRDTPGGKEALRGDIRPRPEGLNVRSAFWIGVSHSLALLPGVSRSGTTISTGLGMGMDVRTAGRFSFLLAIPAVLGAMLLHIGELGSAADDIGVEAIVAGTLASIVVGYLSLDLLFRLLRQGKLYYFGPYCLLVGLLVMTLV